MKTKANTVKTEAGMVKTEAGRMTPLGQKKGQASEEPEVDSESHPSRAPARRARGRSRPSRAPAHLARGRSQRRMGEMTHLPPVKIAEAKMAESKVMAMKMTTSKRARKE